jgi:hypothetical protein
MHTVTDSELSFMAMLRTDCGIMTVKSSLGVSAVVGIREPIMH